MKKFKKLLSMFKKTPAPVRGRVLPVDPDATSNGAMRARSRPIPHCKYRVYRAKTGTWESFRDAQIKSTEGQD